MVFIVFILCRRATRYERHKNVTTRMLRTTCNYLSVNTITNRRDDR
jgi:hypothetical protein